MILAATALRLRYPMQDQWAIDGIDCTFHPGEITWVTGGLGAGSSTLLLGLAGLAPRLTGGERDGAVLLDGVDVARLNPLQGGIGYLGESPSLQLSGIASTVREEIAVGPINLAQPRDTIARQVGAAMHELNLAHLAGRDPTALSGGETQRVIIAALLASTPRVWLMDEPFSALDRASTQLVRQLIRRRAEQGDIVVVACDDADRMLGAADRLLVLRRGHVVLDGTPDQLLGGDAVLAAGAGTTDAATLAIAAGWSAPRPLTSGALLDQLDLSGSTASGSTANELFAPEVVSLSHDGPRLEMADVSFEYRANEPVLRHVSLQIMAAAATGLFGQNGAGKSTLLRLAMALQHPRSGTVTTLGRNTAGLHPEDLAPGAGFLFQQPERQLFRASVRAECMVAAQFTGRDAAWIEASTADVLDHLGLADAIDQHPYDLPVPRRRLVALAAILVAQPRLLLLDEPTAALDSASRDRVITAVRAQIARGTAVLAVTHDPVFALEALDHGVLLTNGVVAHHGPVRDILDGQQLARPAALAAALRLELRPGADRRATVAPLLRRAGTA
jgi:energy-coupling factor transporter ATP-binding protein EcfA2